MFCFTNILNIFFSFVTCSMHKNPHQNAGNRLRQRNKGLNILLTMYGYYDLNVFDYVSVVSHNRTRNCENFSLMLKVPSCKTSTFQFFFFNRIVHLWLWNIVCRTAKPSDLRSLTMFRSFL